MNNIINSYHTVHLTNTHRPLVCSPNFRLSNYWTMPQRPDRICEIAYASWVLIAIAVEFETSCLAHTPLLALISIDALKTRSSYELGLFTFENSIAKFCFVYSFMNNITRVAKVHIDRQNISDPIYKICINLAESYCFRYNAVFKI